MEFSFYVFGCQQLLPLPLILTTIIRMVDEGGEGYEVCCQHASRSTATLVWTMGMSGCSSLHSPLQLRSLVTNLRMLHPLGCTPMLNKVQTT